MKLLAWLPSIHHDGSALYVEPQVYQLNDLARLRVRAAPDAPLEQVFVRICPDGEQLMVPMKRTQAGPVAQWWEAKIAVSMPATGYRFWLLTAQGGWWLTAAGVQRSTPTDATDFRLLADLAAPDWVRSSVFYQIFPDRFADGEPSNNVRTGEYLCGGQPVIARPWGVAPRSHRESGGVEFFGGDLQGIAQRLDYLEDLGINALYLNPIFTAPSNHKYDTADYDHVDPHFGGDEALIALRTALDQRGMHVILDIVLNHCGVTHHWFQAAQANRQARSADFFTWLRYPAEYETWLGHKSLPKLNYASAALREAVYAADDAVVRRWLRPPFRIDGWRLDVANMMARQGPTQLGHKLGRALRRAIKAEAPAAYVLGEHFYDGSSHLQGAELDASMNYRGFSFPLLHWLAGFDMAAAWGFNWADPAPLPTADLALQWRTFLAAIPWQIAVQQFNLLDSHDTPRIYNIVGGDPALVRLAATLQMTFPGVPCVYYGDELGLEGAGDPFCRGCMVWDESAWDQELRGFYRDLIQLRRSSTALSAGGFQILLAQGETLAFVRHSPNDMLLIVAQRQAGPLPGIPLQHAAVPDGSRFRRLDTGTELSVADGLLVLDDSAAGATIWRLVSPAQPDNDLRSSHRTQS